MDTNEKRRQLEKLEAEASKLRNSIKYEVANCKHTFGPTISDPTTKQEAVFSHLEPHGSDPNPVYNYYTKEVPRWSRTCTKCGHKEYATELAPTKFEPKF